MLRHQYKKLKYVMIGDAIAYAHIHKPDISIQKSSDD